MSAELVERGIRPAQKRRAAISTTNYLLQNQIANTINATSKSGKPMASQISKMSENKENQASNKSHAGSLCHFLLILKKHSFNDFGMTKFDPQLSRTGILPPELSAWAPDG